ncbi:TPA: hypothetical protein ACGIK9_002898 [Acinetobacter baumannii]|uniref:hypothetical protein n=1 Tax=Acinetobacter baumannii TaxID=470 RepID=UPI00338DFDDD
MSKITTEISNPLKVINARLKTFKNKLNGIEKIIERKAIYNDSQMSKNKSENAMILDWDDWIHAALELLHNNKMRKEAKNGNRDVGTDFVDKILGKSKTNYPFSTGPRENPIVIPKTENNVYETALNQILKARNINPVQPKWAENLNVNDEIPQELIDEIPVHICELVTLGNWMFHKNIYRFEDVVIKELLKASFSGVLPTYILNLPYLSTYIQTDNADLTFQDKQIIGVIFGTTLLNDQKILVTSLFLEDGSLSHINLLLDDNEDIESSLGEFFEAFQPQLSELITDEIIEEKIELQKKLINLVLWFSMKEPEVIPQQNDKAKFYNFQFVERQRRLFESKTYKVFKVGGKTAREYKRIYEEYDKSKTAYSSGKRVGATEPKMRVAHWQLYWYGKRHIDESSGKRLGEYWEVKLKPMKLIGGIPKNTGTN